MELIDSKYTGERLVVLDGFLEATQRFNEDFKEEIEKEKEEYLKKQGIYN